MAKFLNKDFTDDQLRGLVEFTSFNSMSKKNENFTQLFVDLNLFTKETQFFRKGKVGDWQNYLTEDHSKQIDEKIKENLKSKIEFNYGDKN